VIDSIITNALALIGGLWLAWRLLIWAIALDTLRMRGLLTWSNAWAALFWSRR
jgi:hypothetical protein